MPSYLNLRAFYLSALFLTAVAHAAPDTPACQSLGNLNKSGPYTFRDAARDSLNCLNDIVNDKNTNFGPTADKLLADKIAKARLLKLREQSCLNKYQHMYDDGALEIGIYFGYGDPGEPGQDGNFILGNRDYLVNVLLAECPKDSKVLACGFRGTFSKNIVGDGGTYKISRRIPSLDGRPDGTLVNITLAAAPLSPSEKFNNSPENQKFQEDLSNATHEAFLKSLGQADIVIYSGHSRDGGGPDFYPPILLPNGHVNYAFYRKYKKQIKEVASTLKDASLAGKEPGIFASISCGSDRFAPRLIEASPRTALVLSSDLVYPWPDNVATLGLIDSALNKRCGNDTQFTMDSFILAFKATKEFVKSTYRVQNF